MKKIIYLGRVAYFSWVFLMLGSFLLNKDPLACTSTCSQLDVSVGNVTLPYKSSGPQKTKFNVSFTAKSTSSDNSKPCTFAVGINKGSSSDDRQRYLFDTSSNSNKIPLKVYKFNATSELIPISSSNEYDSSRTVTGSTNSSSPTNIDVSFDLELENVGADRSTSNTKLP